MIGWYLVRASAENGKWRGHDLSEALSGGFGGEVLSALDGGEGGEQNLGLGFFFFCEPHRDPLIVFVSCIRAINYLLFLVLFC